jgi:hypothetical protein
MVFSQVRDYFSEFRKTKLTEWKLFQKFGVTAPDPNSPHPDSDLRRLAKGFRHRDIEQYHTDEYHNHHRDTYYGFLESDHMKGSPFEFYMDYPLDQIPDKRQSSPGIKTLPYKYHSQQVVSANDKIPETGFAIHPLLQYLLTRKWHQYMPAVQTYCRPLGTTDATFSDFNKEQIEYPPIPTDIASKVMNLVIEFMNAKKYLPLHYVDTFFTKMPLHTGTSYYYRHSYEHRTHAAFSHPPLYAGKQTSKGYMLNAFTEWARTVVHRIKEFGLPFSPEKLTPEQVETRLKRFFLEHATMLFTRNHISQRDGTLKQRPVYAMDTLFLHLEAMVTFPLHIMARSVKSSLMYSLETIRGGCAYMDSLAQSYKSYLCIDWSSFDQRMPWIIVDLFFTLYIPSLLVVSAAYQPTAEYSEYPDLTTEKVYNRMFNIISFLRLWYYNCVFVTADGFAYARTLAGIASGMLNTQYLDSVCNLFLMIHSLLHFGATESEIRELCIFVMGDDNVLLSNWDAPRLYEFMTFFEHHALTRFGMVLSTQKSIFTTLRSKIEMLGYQIHFGQPKRSIPKLVAQVCYPEHGPIEKYMSARAVGAAWASAGQDEELYEFLKDVYHTFEPYRDKNTPPDPNKVLKHLPGVFKMLDDPSEFVNPDRFPTLSEIRHRYAHWQGELDIFSKWSPAHFVNLPDTVPSDSVTMNEFMAENGLQFPAVKQYFT